MLSAGGSANHGGGRPQQAVGGSLWRGDLLFAVFAHPKGRYNISICLGTACYVKGAAAVLDKVSSALGIQPEECTPDGKFSLTACRCIGACGLAPVMTINDDVYGRLVPEEVDGILAKYND